MASIKGIRALVASQYSEDVPCVKLSRESFAVELFAKGLEILNTPVRRVVEGMRG